MQFIFIIINFINKDYLIFKFLVLKIKENLRNPTFFWNNFVSFSFLLSLLWNGKLDHKILMILNILRAVSILELLDYLKIMKILVKENYISIIFNILLLNVIFSLYAILGQNLFYKKFENNYEIYKIFNFDSFTNSYQTVFSIITLENWFKIYIESSSYEGSDKFLPKIYFFSLIFFGNYVFYHFFLVIILNAFESLKQINMEEIDDLDLQVILENNLRTNSMKKLSFDRKSELIPHTVSMFEDKEKNIRKEKPPGSALRKKNNESFHFIKEKILKESFVRSYGSSTKGASSYFTFKEIFYSEKSLNIFPKDNIVRSICDVVSKNKKFDKLVYIFIIGSTVKLSIETFFDKKDKNLNDSTSQNLKNISQIMSITINIFFTNVIIMKIISNGFIFSEKNFCQDKLNIVNLLAVIGFYLNLIFSDIEGFQIFFEV